jgi:nucleoside recognition membrane protein YjiH
MGTTQKWYCQCQTSKPRQTKIIEGKLSTVSAKFDWNTALKNAKGMFFPQCVGVTVELVLRQTPPVILHSRHESRTSGGGYCQHLFEPRRALPRK